MRQKLGKFPNICKVFYSFFLDSTFPPNMWQKVKKKKKKQACSNSPVPLCTCCWIPAQEHKACSGSIAAPRRSSTRPEKKSASSPPSGAAVVHRQAGFGAAVCGAQCRESHGCRIQGDFSLNRLWFLCSPVFFSTYTLFFLQPRADNTTRYHVTLNPFSAVCARQFKPDDDDGEDDDAHTCGCRFFFLFWSNDLSQSSLSRKRLLRYANYIPWIKRATACTGSLLYLWN